MKALIPLTIGLGLVRAAFKRPLTLSVEGTCPLFQQTEFPKAKEVAASEGEDFAKKVLTFGAFYSFFLNDFFETIEDMNKSNDNNNPKFSEEFYLDCLWELDEESVKQFGLRNRYQAEFISRKQEVPFYFTVSHICDAWTEVDADGFFYEYSMVSFYLDFNTKDSRKSIFPSNYEKTTKVSFFLKNNYKFIVTLYRLCFDEVVTAKQNNFSSKKGKEPRKCQMVNSEGYSKGFICGHRMHDNPP